MQENFNIDAIEPICSFQEQKVIDNLVEFLDSLIEKYEKFSYIDLDSRPSLSLGDLSKLTEHVLKIRELLPKFASFDGLVILNHGLAEVFGQSAIKSIENLKNEIRGEISVAEEIKIWLRQIQAKPTCSYNDIVLRYQQMIDCHKRCQKILNSLDMQFELLVQNDDYHNQIRH